MSDALNPNRQFKTADKDERTVWNVLWTVNDPELPVSIVDLGLVYDVNVNGNVAEIDMTLTYSGCPARKMIVDEVETAVKALPSIESVDVSIVYSPPWSIDRITDAGRKALVDYGLAVPEASATCQ